MIASQRAGEITFYEELGVPRGASPQDIRDAFRSLVRLLHPDQQTDPQLKAAAEKQMRKLNRIYAVLSDPERRRRYDEILDGEYEPPAALIAISDPDFSRAIAKFVWVAAIVVSAGLLVWLAVETAPGSPIRAREPNSASPSTASPASPNPLTADQAAIARLRSDLNVVTLERDAAMHELGRLRGTVSALKSSAATRAERPESGLPVPVLAALPPPARDPAVDDSAPSRAESPAGRKLAGFWFYAVPVLGQHNKNQALYPPEYIEATIKEESGMIYGKYRARFQIVDRAISPDVNFTFTGSVSPGASASLPWTGAAGAKGQLTLKLVSENSLRIDWNATELGDQQGLNAGTATLTRRIE